MSRGLALALRHAGLPWNPASGDRFSLLDENFAGDVFTLADMTIEPQGPAGRQVLGFNGTTEWALDSVEFVDALWLPREDQLRELLGAYFRGLELTDQGYEVTVHLPGEDPRTIPAETAPDAYALAVLARLGAAEEAAGRAAPD
ncbi:pilus assembly protein CpaE [Nakamurella sp. YIM 132087]|uniref:Pilus assembly protein CpaE n=1 Tax=Nakamurella alba TaxID=2665158 RepID=A0A7K1FP06_9ACTN|nr:pilus assembly protein CpaE [Nakamurella alba]